MNEKGLQMNLSQLANIADLLAAAGVVGTMFFVAYELRRSNKENQLANWRQLLDSLREFKAITNDVSFSELIERGNADFASLSAAEQRSYGQYLEQGIHVIGNFSKHDGKTPNKLGGLELALDNTFVDLLNTRGARHWWREYKPKGKLMPQTYQTIDRLLAAANEP